MNDTQLDAHQVKKIRATLEELVLILKDNEDTRELSLAIVKLQEGKMWLGKHLGTNFSEGAGKDLNAERDAKELAGDQNDSPNETPPEQAKPE